MKPTRTTYTIVELLDDDYFIESVLHPTSESDVFWESLLADGLIDPEEFARARHFILLMHPPRRNISEKEKALLLASIVLENKRRLNHDLRRKQYFLYGTVAVLLFVLVTVGYTWLSGDRRPDSADFESIMARMPDVGTATNDIQLILSEDTTITLDVKKADIVVQKGGNIVLNETRQVEQKDKKDDNAEPALNQLVVPYGRHSLLTLADGTKMYVNSGTRVIFPNEFEGKTRNIFVDGEVYLEVARNEKIPFLVHTHQMDVNVLGTSFNVNAYEKDGKSEVVLVSGSVKVQTKGQKEAYLSPNQIYNYTNGASSVAFVDAKEYTSWKDGYFIYRGELLENVIKQLSRYYNVSIDYDPAFSSIHCSGKLDLKEDVGQVIADLSDMFRLKVRTIEGGYHITTIN